MSEKVNIVPLGPYIGGLVSGVDLSRGLSDNQFEQIYHALIRHQVLFFRNLPITPLQQRSLAQRFGDLHIHPVYPHAQGVEEIIVLDTHNDNPPDNDNWHTDVTFIDTPPAGAILAAKQVPETGVIHFGRAVLPLLKRFLHRSSACCPGLKRSMISANHSLNTSIPARWLSISAGWTRRQKILRCTTRWCVHIR